MSDPDVIDIGSRTDSSETTTDDTTTNTAADSMSDSNPPTDADASPPDASTSTNSVDNDTQDDAPPADAVSDTAAESVDTVDSTDSSSPDTDTGPFNMVVQASVLQDVVDVIKTLVDECKVHLNADGLTIRAVDAANVGMVSLSLNDAACERYTAPGDAVIGINIEQLDDIIGMASTDDIVTLQLNTDHKLTIEFNNLSYTLALIDPDSVRQEPDIPDLDLPAAVTIEGAQLDRGISASDMVSDHVRFNVYPDDDTFEISATGDTDDVNLTITEDEAISLTAAEADSLFDLEYLTDINRALPKDKELSLALGDDFPMMLRFTIADAEGDVEFMLAPRIEAE